ncbi:hypothetical protein GCM10020219_072650 [Nonomuraea dietziae]
MPTPSWPQWTARERSDHNAEPDLVPMTLPEAQRLFTRLTSGPIRCIRVRLALVPLATGVTKPVPAQATTTAQAALP